MKPQRVNDPIDIMYQCACTYILYRPTYTLHV